ncbi:Interleukin-37 [Manis pentadactyla]|nr:Interleukin-37 [Manis pentadactyla]
MPTADQEMGFTAALGPSGTRKSTALAAGPSVEIPVFQSQKVCLTRPFGGQEPRTGTRSLISASAHPGWCLAHSLVLERVFC